MLLALHNTLRQLIYERGNISSREVDITFEVPTRERIDKLIRPAINMFLFDLRYMVSVLATAVEDKHELIWGILLTLLRHPQFPAELLSEEVRSLEPAPITKASQVDEEQRLSGV